MHKNQHNVHAYMSTISSFFRVENLTSHIVFTTQSQTCLQKKKKKNKEKEEWKMFRTLRESCWPGMLLTQLQLKSLRKSEEERREKSTLVWKYSSKIFILIVNIYFIAKDFFLSLYIFLCCERIKRGEAGKGSHDFSVLSKASFWMMILKLPSFLPLLTFSFNIISRSTDYCLSLITNE